MKKEAILQPSEIGTPGCGGGRNACFALNSIPGHWFCLLVDDPKAAAALRNAGYLKTNLDPSDDKPWCPKGKLPNSKWLV